MSRIIRQIKIPFGRDANGRMISAGAAQRGLDCECVCAECGDRLIAAKGDIYQHHFRHLVERDGSCSLGGETAIHLFAKQLICDRLRVGLPDPVGSAMVDAVPEYRIDDLIPDVLCTYDTGETVAVEIWVAHQVPGSKVDRYNDMRQAAVEIDLRPYRLTSKNEVDWEEAILNKASRTWLSPPNHIRVQREREREEELRRRRELLEAARLAAKEQERLRVGHEELLHALKSKEAEQEQIKEQYRAIWAAKHREELKEEEIKREQIRLSLAEERNKKAEYLKVIEDRLRREMLPPDLQGLVIAHGGYNLIPPEAWTEFDADRKRWQAAIRTGKFWEPPYASLRRGSGDQ